MIKFHELVFLMKVLDHTPHDEHSDLVNFKLRSPLSSLFMYRLIPCSYRPKNVYPDICGLFVLFVYKPHHILSNKNDDFLWISIPSSIPEKID